MGISLFGYLKVHARSPLDREGNSRFEILRTKMFSLTQKAKPMLTATIAASLQETSMVSLDKRLQWVNVKQKPFRQI